MAKYVVDYPRLNSKMKDVTPMLPPDEAVTTSKDKLKQLAPKTVERLDSLAEGDGVVALQANIHILDRALGKPTQEVRAVVSITSEELRAVLEEAERRLIDVTPQSGQTPGMRDAQIPNLDPSPNPDEN